MTRLAASTRTVVRMTPRSIVALLAEMTGRASLYVEGAKIPGRAPAKGYRNRFSLLTNRSIEHSPHVLFDPAYYRQTNPDVKSSPWPPLLHFLLWGGFEGRKPHPLFDPDWYLTQNPDVVRSKLNPLQHYVRFGRFEGRSPHPLFDGARYLEKYPDVQREGYDPLIHFLLWGGKEGRQPHPLFDCAWYLSRHRGASESGLNPLMHYLLHGASDSLSPNRHFDTRRYLQHHPPATLKGMAPLVHFITSAERGGYDPHPGYPLPVRGGRSSAAIRAEAADSLTLVGRRSLVRASPSPWRNTVRDTVVPVFVVYGSSNVRSLETRLIPALAAQQSAIQFHLHTLHYGSAQNLLSPSTLAFSGGGLHGVTDWSASRENRHIGFGESVNCLFERVSPENCFYLVNPDSTPMSGCMDRLMHTFRSRSAAIVEARQWPSEHPKEFDPSSGTTPWASGAFLLIAAEAFRRLGGFDPIYFLYNEDVDLSWRAWLADMPVVYEPGAVCAHLTGALSYSPTRFYYEHFFGIRNFLVIAYKFFGERGERAAWNWIQQAPLPSAFVKQVETSYLGLRGRVNRVHAENPYYGENVKILGLNLYHRLRPV